MPDLPDLAKVDYLDRVNRAIDHIHRHLAEPLYIEDLARVACFSTYHFHRIFSALVGETLAQFVKRVRLERAVQLMSDRPAVSLTDIALACGFGSSSDFSRSFRAHFGVPPRAFDTGRYRTMRREAMQAAASPEEPHRLQRLPRGQNPDGFAVQLREVPPRRVAYLSVSRPYEGDRVPAAAARLVAWARERDLERGQWLGFQWENPEVVSLERCRYIIGLEVPRDAEVAGEPSVVELPAMKLAEVPIAGTVELELRAFDWLYGTWLPSSGWAPDHQPAFEAFEGAPFAQGTAHFALRVQIAIVDAATPP